VMACHVVLGFLVLLADASPGNLRRMLLRPQAVPSTPAAGPTTDELAIKKVVIVGGSFGGWTVAKKLSGVPERRASDGSRVKLDVTLIDRADYFEYTPGVLRALTQPSVIPMLHSEVGAGTDASVVRGNVEEIQGSKVVLMELDGADAKTKREIDFDYCVIATGSEYSHPIKAAGTGEWTREERQNVLLEKAWQLGNATDVAIVGGGIVGVELAADIIYKYPEKNVKVLDMQNSLLPELPPQCGKYARKWLEGKGVKVELGAPADLSALRDEDYQIFMCVGYKPNGHVYKSEEESPKPDRVAPRGALIVDNMMNVGRQKNVFAVGDVMSHPQPEAKTAYTADLSGNYVARAIKALTLDTNAQIKPYPELLTGLDSVPLVTCVSLGAWDGILVFNNFALPGKFAALVKWLIFSSKTRQLRGNAACNFAWDVAESLSFILHRLDRARRKKTS